MPAAPLPSDEAERLNDLRANRILDTPPESAFDDLTRRAKETCGVPIAHISFLDGKRQWFKSRLGFHLGEVPREQSICAHALLTPDQPLIVPDATVDPRFADNPFVTGEPGIRFYAGIPLRSPEGYGLGTLCVLDLVPRQLSPTQLDALRAIAHEASVRVRWRRRAPAIHPLALGFGFGIALLLCMALFFVLQAARFLTSDDWVTHTQQVIRQLDDTLFEIQAAESSQRDYTATGEDSYLTPYRAAVASLPVRLTTLCNLVSDNPPQRRNCEELEAHIRAKLAVTQERLAQWQAVGSNTPESLALDARGRDLMEAVIAKGREMIEVEDQLLRQRGAARSIGLYNAEAVLLVGNAMGTALLVGSGWLVRRELRRSHALGEALAQANLGLESEVADRRRAQGRLIVQHAVARIAAEDVCLPEAAPRLFEGIGEHLDWQMGQLWTVDESCNRLRLSHQWHRPGPGVESAASEAFAAAARLWSFATGEGLPGRVWADGAAAWEYALAGERGFMDAEAVHQAGLHRAFAFPLRIGARDTPSSVMLFLGREPGIPDAELTVTMDALASQIAQFAERCRAEAALRASQARFTAFMENTPALAYIKDEAGRLVYANQTLLQLFGFRREESLGKTDAELWPETASTLREHDRRALSAGAVLQVQESVPRRDGAMTHWLSYKFPLHDEWTGGTLVAGMSIDVTARERVKAALRGEREFLSALLDNLQAGVVACDAQGHLTHCNRAAAALYGFSVDDSPPPIHRWAEYFDLLPGGGAARVRKDADPLARALRGEVLRDREFLILPKNGPERTLSLNAAPFADGNGQRLGAVAVIHDVTARQQAREAALRSLREKEVLLQEIHHRVKNNLQIIGSLLAMQARRTTSTPAVQALQESAGRVRSIALVHEKLYRSANLECIEAADYLRSLARNLMETFGAERFRSHNRVSLTFQLEEGHQLDAPVAIACGLIVNEALTNSFKHGFPDGRQGRVTLALARLVDGVNLGSVSPSERGNDLHGDENGDGRRQWLRLEVQDDGVGVPASAFTPAGGAELARRSLGIRLVRDLSKQIGGWFELRPTDAGTGAGLTLRVSFPSGGLPPAGSPTAASANGSPLAASALSA